MRLLRSLLFAALFILPYRAHAACTFSNGMIMGSCPKAELDKLVQANPKAENHAQPVGGDVKSQTAPSANEKPADGYPVPTGQCSDGRGKCYTPEQVAEIKDLLRARYPDEDMGEVIDKTLSNTKLTKGDVRPSDINSLDKYIGVRGDLSRAWQLARKTQDPQDKAKARALSQELRALMKGPLANTTMHEALMYADARMNARMKMMDARDYQRSEPNNPAPYTYTARELLAGGKYAEALAAADRALQLGGGADALGARSSANLALGDYRAAEADARAALDFDPADKVANANLQMSVGRSAGGGGGGGAAASYTPQNAGGAAYGRGFMGGGSGGGGGYSFGTAKRAPGAAAAARFNDQARSAFSLGDARATLDFAARALAADPDNARAYYLRAMAYRSMGDWKAALEAAAKGLQLAPKDAGLMAVYGNALNRAKDYKGALAAANLALEVNARDAWAFANRAYALGALGDREGMLESLRQAAALDPAFQKSLDQALQAPTDADLLFLFPGETATDKKGAMGTAGRKKSFGLLAGAAALGGLFIALGLLSSVLAPLTDKVSSVFTRMTRRSPSVTASPKAAARVAVSGLLRGQFELGKQIGAGGMGLVYEGTDLSLNRRVAVKRMRDEIRLDPRERARFVSEAKTVAGLHHPNIVDIYAIVEESDDLHLVFEYVEGRTVHELLSAKSRFTPAEAARVVRGAADALDYAHGRGVIHRDMKPSNLMIDGSGRVKVMDFGIARVAKDAMTRVSMTNTVVGTPPYMAPEQEQGQVRKESDVYALAICAYELLCGRLPFPGVGAGMLMNKINLSYVPPSKMNDTLPAGIDQVFAKAFQPDPEKRYHASGEFAAALEAAVASPVRA